MAKKQKRDIYKSIDNAGFDINKDIDLAHLRQLMITEELNYMDYNYYGLYVKNIIKIMLNSSHFRGYPDDVKEDMEGEATIDMLKARLKFKADKYPQPTAPFNYLYRIGFHSFQHVLRKYYQIRNKIIPESELGSEEFSLDALTSDHTVWDV